MLTFLLRKSFDLFGKHTEQRPVKAHTETTHGGKVVDIPSHFANMWIKNEQPSSPDSDKVKVEDKPFVPSKRIRQNNKQSSLFDIFDLYGTNKDKPKSDDTGNDKNDNTEKNSDLSDTRNENRQKYDAAQRERDEQNLAKLKDIHNKIIHEDERGEFGIMESTHNGRKSYHIIDFEDTDDDYDKDRYVPSYRARFDSAKEAHEELDSIYDKIIAHIKSKKSVPKQKKEVRQTTNLGALFGETNPNAEKEKSSDTKKRTKKDDSSYYSASEHSGKKFHFTSGLQMPARAEAAEKEGTGFEPIYNDDGSVNEDYATVRGKKASLNITGREVMYRPKDIDEMKAISEKTNPVESKNENTKVIRKVRARVTKRSSDGTYSLTVGTRNHLSTQISGATRDRIWLYDGLDKEHVNRNEITKQQEIEIQAGIRDKKEEGALSNETLKERESVVKKRTGLSTGEIIFSPSLVTSMQKTLNALLYKNELPRLLKNRHGVLVANNSGNGDVDRSEEIYSEFLRAAHINLQRSLSMDSDDDVRDFLKYLARRDKHETHGDFDVSTEKEADAILEAGHDRNRIVAKMMLAGRADATKKLKAHDDEHKIHDSYDESEDDEDTPNERHNKRALVHDVSQKYALQKQNAVSTLNKLFEEHLTTAEKKMMRYKFGIRAEDDDRDDDVNAMSSKAVASKLNGEGVFDEDDYGNDVHWTEDTVDKAIKDAIQVLRDNREDGRHFTKSFSTFLTLRLLQKAFLHYLPINQSHQEQVHVNTYTRVDPVSGESVTVQEHYQNHLVADQKDTPKKHDDILLHQNATDDDVHSGSTLNHGDKLIDRLSNAGWSSSETHHVTRDGDWVESEIKDEPIEKPKVTEKPKDTRVDTGVSQRRSNRKITVTDKSKANSFNLDGALPSIESGSDRAKSVKKLILETARQAASKKKTSADKAKAVAESIGTLQFHGKSADAKDAKAFAQSIIDSTGHTVEHEKQNRQKQIKREFVMTGAGAQKDAPKPTYNIDKNTGEKSTNPAAKSNNETMDKLYEIATTSDTPVTDLFAFKTTTGGYQTSSDKYRSLLLKHFGYTVHDGGKNSERKVATRLEKDGHVVILHKQDDDKHVVTFSGVDKEKQKQRSNSKEELARRLEHGNIEQTITNNVKIDGSDIVLPKKTDEQKKYEEVLKHCSEEEKKHIPKPEDEHFFYIKQWRDKVPFTWAVVDGSKLITSNDVNGNVNTAYNFDFQNRTRSNPSSIAQMHAISENPTFDGMKEGASATNGAPIILIKDGRAIVIAGNGRVAGLQEAYRRGNATSYSAKLKHHAHEMGFDLSEVSKTHNPTFVRIMNTDGMSHERIKEIAALTNTTDILGFDPTAQAINDSKVISPNTANSFRTDESGNPVHQDSTGFYDNLVKDMSKHISPVEASSMLGNNNSEQYNKMGLERMHNALFHYTYRSEPFTNEYATCITQNTNISSSLARVMDVYAPIRVKLDALEASGKKDIADDYDLMPDITKAVRAILAEYNKANSERTPDPMKAAVSKLITSPELFAVTAQSQTKYQDRGTKPDNNSIVSLLDDGFEKHTVTSEYYRDLIRSLGNVWTSKTRTTAFLRCLGKAINSELDNSVGDNRFLFGGGKTKHQILVDAINASDVGESLRDEEESSGKNAKKITSDNEKKYKKIMSDIEGRKNVSDEDKNFAHDYILNNTPEGQAIKNESKTSVQLHNELKRHMNDCNRLEERIKIAEDDGKDTIAEAIREELRDKQHELNNTETRFNDITNKINQMKRAIRSKVFNSTENTPEIDDVKDDTIKDEDKEKEALYSGSLF